MSSMNRHSERDLHLCRTYLDNVSGGVAISLSIVVAVSPGGTSECVRHGWTVTRTEVERGMGVYEVAVSKKGCLLFDDLYSEAPIEKPDTTKRIACRFYPNKKLRTVKLAFLHT